MIFNVWNPARTSDDEVAFDVTQANAPRVAAGDANWIASCLRAIGVSAKASGWSIQPARCYFYSDYAEEPEWRDRWPDTWIVKTRLDGRAPDEFGPPSPLPRLVDQYDSTWSYGETDPEHDRTALLILIVRGSIKDASEARDRILTSIPLKLPTPTTIVEKVCADWSRIRILLTGSLFPDQAEPIEKLLLQCRQQNLVINRNQLD